MDATLDIPQLGMLRNLTADEWRDLKSLFSELRTLDPRTTVSQRGERLDYSLLLLDGIVGRIVPGTVTGDSHLVALQVAGDFIDLHSFPLKALDHDVTSITEARVAVIRHDTLRDWLDDNSRSVVMLRQLWRLTLVDASIHRHWALRNGTMRALARIANLFCEMSTRLEAAGLGSDGRFRLGLTQHDIGDACGLSNVHVNRVLRDLREAGCCTYAKGVLTILDMDRLHETGQFEDAYLYLPPEAPDI